MKRQMALMIVGILTGFLEDTSLASNLVNKDSKAYSIKIDCGSGTTMTSISSNTTATGSAKKGCTLTVIESESTLKVSGDGGAKIKDGKLSE